MSFRATDLTQFHQLLNSAKAVVSLREVHAGNTSPSVIGLRHDVDDNQDSFQTAQKIARWEARYGFRSTYFVLHTASYWTDEPFFRTGLEEIACLGHEIGIHANAIAEALKTGGDPHDILYRAVDELRDWGFTVTGVAGHGDEVCRIAGFVNDEQFEECARPEMGSPTRKLVYRGNELHLAPLPLRSFGLAYESYRLPKVFYLSDSGGAWNDLGAAEEIAGRGHLHILQHPDWWANAFVPDRVAA